MCEFRGEDGEDVVIIRRVGEIRGQAALGNGCTDATAELEDLTYPGWESRP